MDKNALTEILRDAGASRGKDGVFAFETRQHATLLVGSGGELLSVERVARVAIREAYVVAESDRGERYYLALDHILALRLQVSSEYSGFVGS